MCHWIIRVMVVKCWPFMPTQIFHSKSAISRYNNHLQHVYTTFMIHSRLFVKSVFFFQKQGHFSMIPNFWTVVHIHTVYMCVNSAMLYRFSLQVFYQGSCINTVLLKKQACVAPYQTEYSLWTPRPSWAPMGLASLGLSLALQKYT